MDTNTVISLIGFMGIGAIVKSFVDAILSRKQNQSQKQHDFKEIRYKALILLMLAILDFEKSMPNLKKHGREFSSEEELLGEIKAERDNMILFASDAVIDSIKQFIISPNEDTFYNTAIHMRKDLYGLKTKLRANDLLISK